ncbi:hypothetical protein IWQ55_001156 [Labrenzia sp. EL_208]|uniref:hypothetical protein n=1 Tax=Roseibium album TaxID=311410 RepID=UPI0018CA58C9|nr:hypothetical protein [Labrenzia sp. EL_162]MBG6163678.1 hypothetical protein [Labrenzia sp. EL_195]MBG6173272.1 hypothetical protein [Labrenzia sp. EL_132]MBG6195350.1 hypothetical protein [Labrenzia sp. EL_159]MBG6227958.1 hypothetical protein [Labrenzia sp. EL_208]
MASIDNIAGWREEYEYLEYGDGTDAATDDPARGVWRAHKNKFVHGMPPKPPISQVLHLVEVMLGNEETRSAMKELSDWWELLEEKGPFEDDDPEMALFPDEAVQLLIEFWQWFCFKAGYPHLGQVFNFVAKEVANKILQGRLPGVHARETEEYLLQNFSLFVSADDEGASQ